MLDPRAARMNDLAVKALISAHSRLEEALLLAVRYHIDSPGIHLIEVLDGFPGEATDEPMETEYGSSPEIRMIGTLRLVLLSPDQFRYALESNAPLLDHVRQGRLEYCVGEGKELAHLLGFDNRARSEELDARRELLRDTGVSLSADELESLKKMWE